MEIENLVCFSAKIGVVTPIVGADKIEQAQMKGWNSIVGKGTHKEGDEVIVLTQDAVIPILLSEKFEFTNYLKHKQGVNYVKTVRLKGVYSECIILSVADVDSFIGFTPKDGNYQKALGIIKFEEEDKVIIVAGMRIRKDKANQHFQVYHKFPNAKNVPTLFELEDEVIITRKIHGTNARFGMLQRTSFAWYEIILKYIGLNVFVNKWEYVVGSHNTQKNKGTKGFYESDVWKRISDAYQLEEKIKSHIDPDGKSGTGLVLYGEIYGPGIQKGYTYDLKEISVKFFDIVENGLYLNPDEYIAKISSMGLPSVEVLYTDKFDPGVIESLVGRNIAGTTIPEEGIVVKSVDGLKTAKFINPAYLVHNEKQEGTDFH